MVIFVRLVKGVVVMGELQIRLHGSATRVVIVCVTAFGLEWAHSPGKNVEHCATLGFSALD